ncbi:Armadillo segment polarity protein [Aphelenchoides fujianensis]|nr:Armadillo segment polarity protein [Aphelenchoides fujianensis]
MAGDPGYSMSNGDYHHYDGGYFERRTRASAHRVRRAMFPDFTFEESLEEEYTNRHSILSALAENAAAFQQAIVDLINAPDEAEEVGRRVGTIIQLLASGDPSSAAAAAQEVYLLSKKDAAIAAYMAGSEQLIGALINATRSNDLETQRNAMAALNSLSQQQRRPPYAIRTLHNLLLYLEPAKEEIIALGGLQAFPPRLHEQKPQMQAMVADCLFLILLDRPDCKQTFLLGGRPRIPRGRAGFPHSLLQARLRTHSLHSVVLELLHENFVEVSDPKHKQTFLHAMRNLSDAATTRDTLSGLIRDLLATLAQLEHLEPPEHSTQDEEIISSICGILSNLTCNNVRNKQTVYQAGGIPILVHVAGHYGNIEDITEPALCTLRHCTVRHPAASQAQTELRSTPRGYQILLTLLSTRRPPIVKAALGVARNCAIQDQNLHALLKETTKDGQRLLPITIELVETSVSVLHQLARDPHVAESIYMNSTLLKMEKINNNEDLLILREVLGLLYQLTNTAEGARAVKMCGVIPFVVDAYKSANDAIAAYATVILRNLGVERPAHNYQHNSHSSTDTLGSHGRIVEQEYRGHNGWTNDGMDPEVYNELFDPRGEMKYDHIETTQQGTSWFDTDL